MPPSRNGIAPVLRLNTFVFEFFVSYEPRKPGPSGHPRSIRGGGVCVALCHTFLELFRFRNIFHPRLVLKFI